MANTGGNHAHQYFAGFGAVYIDLGNLKWLAGFKGNSST
jgi:hypothetical protein